MTLRQLFSIAGIALALSACSGPTDPRDPMMGDDDDMMLNRPAAAAAGR
jgi:hypothetical protein